MRARSLGLVLFAAAGLASCGSVSASVKDLRRDAGMICRHTNHAFRAVVSPRSPAQDTTFLASGLARLKVELRRLQALHPPHDVADVYTAGVTALGQEVAALRQALGAIRHGQDPGLAYRALGEQITPLKHQVDDAWQALLIADCLQ